MGGYQMFFERYNEKGIDCQFVMYETKNLQEMAERFYWREAPYLACILADKIYRKRECFTIQSS